MPANMKRPAAVAKPAPAKRQKDQNDQNADATKDIVAAFAQRTKVGDPALPADVAEMFTAMLPAALQKSPGVDRHKFQDDVLNLIAAELKVLEAALIADVEYQQKTVVGSDDVRAQRTTAEAAARAEAEAKASAAASAKQNLDAAISAAAEGKAKLKEVESAVAAARVAKADAEKKEIALKAALETKAKLEAPDEAASTESATPAESTSPARSPKATRTPPRSPGKLRAEVTAWAKSLQGTFDDEDLLEAARLSLVKPPGDRGDFDNRVSEQLQIALTQALAEQTQAVQALDVDIEARSAAVTETQAAAHSLSEARLTAELAESDAQCAKVSAQQQLRDASRAIADFDSELKAAAGQAAVAESKLAEYRTNVLNVFDRLRNPPTPEAPALETADGPAPDAPADKAEQ